MLNGKEKAQVLLSLLKEQSKDVLSHLSAESAPLLTSGVEDAPKPDSKTTKELLSEVLQKIEALKSAAAAEAAAQAEEALPPIEEPIAEAPLEPLTGEPFSPMSDESLGPLAEPIDKSNLRSGPEIAEILAKQRPQVVAFMLMRTGQPLRDEILTNLPEELVQKIESSEVETVPLSDKVYENLYKTIFEKSPEMAAAYASMPSEQTISAA